MQVVKLNQRDDTRREIDRDAARRNRNFDGSLGGGPVKRAQLFDERRTKKKRLPTLEWLKSDTRGVIIDNYRHCRRSFGVTFHAENAARRGDLTELICRALITASALANLRQAVQSREKKGQ